jgi:hypothetical protein
MEMSHSRFEDGYVPDAGQHLHPRVRHRGALARRRRIPFAVGSAADHQHRHLESADRRIKRCIILQTDILHGRTTGVLGVAFAYQ